MKLLLGLTAVIGSLLYKRDQSNLGCLAQWGHWDYIGARDEIGTGMSRQMCHDAGDVRGFRMGKRLRVISEYRQPSPLGQV